LLLLLLLLLLRPHGSQMVFSVFFYLAKSLEIFTQALLDAACEEVKGRGGKKILPQHLLVDLSPSILWFSEEC